MQIVWTSSAQAGLKKIYDYISEYSSKNAIKVVNDLVSAVEKEKKILKYMLRTN